MIVWQVDFYGYIHNYIGNLTHHFGREAEIPADCDSSLTFLLLSIFSPVC